MKKGFEEATDDETQDPLEHVLNSKRSTTKASKEVKAEPLLRNGREIHFMRMLKRNKLTRPQGIDDVAQKKIHFLR